MEAKPLLSKPAGSTWTDDQWEAIVTEGSNVLVAAAAGSGKTAVLVERIIRKISSNTDVDRLLVATFTKAAAAEMKDRIRAALEKELERRPESEHLRRQLALMGRSSITTLHSFCLDVIRKYYPLIGLDPGFRIANETESELMRLDVLDELFEHKYKGEDDDNGSFLSLADRYGGEKGDEPLYRLVLQLHDFAHSHPWPAHWLRETAAAFQAASIDELEGSEWIASLQRDIALTLDGAAALLRQALELTKAPAGPAPYAATFEEDLDVVLELQSVVRCNPWRGWAAPFQSFQFGRLKPMRGDEFDKALQEQAKELREGAKKLVTSLADELFGRDAEQFAEELGELAPIMAALSELVIAFGERYEAAKRAKGLLDFGDLEHYCLRILRSEDSVPGQLVPSVAALEYRRQFDEILLDEYQDTNMVQEAIVSLIERPGRGNRFMVGDVKQSIYRFRLAEPSLFLGKYKEYRTRAEADSDGLRIDLARNFRSRSEVVDGVNAVFRSLMRESVAEMDYDRSAELVCGASYPAPNPPESCKVRIAILDKGQDASIFESDDDSFDEGVRESGAAAEAAELKAAELEARWIAQQLRELIDGGFQVYDGKRKAYRPLQWRDVVILLRATRQWAPVIIEELQGSGIPAYAELGSGYFEATEVETMLSLLRVIDNPYQDIPLAAVLRSPLFALNGEELARIRIRSGGSSYYDAVVYAAGDEAQTGQLRTKLSQFLDMLDRWRTEARQGSLAELLWRIYRETAYYDYAGGLPGGAQRQANLRALHDRARQYEATSFRGLFRFLRFIERMKESGGDLGTARALGEQEDVVRIMSIHKSKGLEFPVVFVAGLGKLFNQQDLRSAFLKHKKLGFGPRFVDPMLRISYPTLPYLAIRRSMRMEALAEEMRILYVALTRPKEKMYMVGTVSDAATMVTRWKSALDSTGLITDFRIAAARSFLDWLGPLIAPALAQSESGNVEREDEYFVGDFVEAMPRGGVAAVSALSDWSAGVVPASIFANEAAATAEGEAYGLNESMEERLQAVVSLALIDDEEPDAELGERLDWRYPHQAAARLAAKTSVTEMKRLHAEVPDDAAALGDLTQSFAYAGQTEGSRSGSTGSYTMRLRRPSFMEEKALTASERGSASHLFMQHVPLNGAPDEETLRNTLSEMVDKRLLTAVQADSIDLVAVIGFFRSELGERLLQAKWVRREVPFSCKLPADRVYRSDDCLLEEEHIMIQGVIDCLFQDERGVVLLDYKTDRIFMKQWESAAERHRFQIELYAEAIEAVLYTTIGERYVFFFDGSQAVRL